MLPALQRSEAKKSKKRLRSMRISYKDLLLKLFPFKCRKHSKKKNQHNIPITKSLTITLKQSFHKYSQMKEVYKSMID